MGYDLLFVKFPEGNHSEKDVPEMFTWRYRDRQLWHSLMWDADPDVRETCDCDLTIDGKHQYFCAEPAAARPKDFAKFRELLKEAGMLDAEEYGHGHDSEEGGSIFEKMTDWLEANPTYYVSFSN